MRHLLVIIAYVAAISGFVSLLYSPESVSLLFAGVAILFGFAYSGQAFYRGRDSGAELTKGTMVTSLGMLLLFVILLGIPALFP